MHVRQPLTRRAALARLALLAGGAAAFPGCATLPRPTIRIATFSADVTPPIGHGMMGGAWLARSVADPLEAHGFILTGAGDPVVYVSLDWCEIRNDAFTRWQEVLAETAGTRRDHVLISTVHQHDAPIADLEAERLLRSRELAGTICDPSFHERAVQAVATALRRSLGNARPLTHIGMGRARVDRAASNRRHVTPDGVVRFDRTSSTRNPSAIAAGEGVIDPWLRVLSFWHGGTPLAAVNFYAVHPMSHYGAGDISADFPGLARRRMQERLPGTRIIYASGASGNVTAGKYNDGSPGNREILAGRLLEAMLAAWEDTRLVPLAGARVRVARLHLEPRSDPGFSALDLERRLSPGVPPFEQCLAAMGMSWRRRALAARPLEVPAIDFGHAQLIVLPGEAYVEYQLAAQRMHPRSFVCVAGYGDAAAGYIPTESHFAEGDTNLRDWCWISAGCEAPMLDAISEALGRPG